MLRIVICSLFIAGGWLCSVAAAEKLPTPKEGLLVRRADADLVREKLRLLQEGPAMVGKSGIRTVADRAVSQWPQVKQAIQPYLSEMLDLEADRNPPGIVPDAAREAAGRLGAMVDATAKLGFIYFLTGEKTYAETAYEIIAAAGEVPRWGWFSWDGANVPQIPFGMYTRNVAFAVDFCWEAWDPQQQRAAVEILAEKGVEHYWRLVSLSPFMGLHHLRSKNQGSNVLSAAVVASIAVGDSVPENRVWFDSLLQIYVWIIAHDIGWAGTNLESGLPGYWSVSMQNLYTAAACLNNARGIDLRVHPAIAEATWYPIMKEATVPPHAHGHFDRPYPKDEVGLSGTMEHKPIQLPSPPYGGSWWYDYATQFPESPATYFISKDYKGRIANAHQKGHSELMDLLWVRTMGELKYVPRPTALFKATDREAMFRSGYGSPHTFLSFNGDMFLSARNEVLCCTSGLAWHFPWHQYAVTESALETEGEAFSPSMVITDSFDSHFASIASAESGPSNVKYYPRPGQVNSHRAYRDRTRQIGYIRSPDRDRVYDYFLFVDRVEHDGERWHAFNWHIWSSPGNEGRYEILRPNLVLARRPNAAVLLATLSPETMTYEQQAIPSQPTVAYVFDHNARLLRAIAGAATPPHSQPITLPTRLWKGGKVVRVAGYGAIEFVDFSHPKQKQPTFKTDLQLEPGCRYRVSVQARKEDARIDENFSWTVNLKLLNTEGNTLMDAAAAYSPRDPHPLKLTSPASNVGSYSDWKETTTHFTAPPGVAAVEATLLPATYGHGTALKETSKVWLTDMTFTPLGAPVRRRRETIVTLAIPLENDGPLPRIQSITAAGGVRAAITHPDGTEDKISVGPGGDICVTRVRDGRKDCFGWQTTAWEIGPVRSQTPSSAAWTAAADGSLSGDVAVSEKSTLEIAGRKSVVQPGVYRYDGVLRPNPQAASLTVNSAESQRRLQIGLAPLAKRFGAERDQYIRRGWQNLAAEAVEVRASGTRDDRFCAENLIDGKTWEMPVDGVVDYAPGNIETTGNGGYERRERPRSDFIRRKPDLPQIAV